MQMLGDCSVLIIIMVFIFQRNTWIRKQVIWEFINFLLSLNGSVGLCAEGKVLCVLWKPFCMGRVPVFSSH